jgi:hypothetical protein
MRANQLLGLLVGVALQSCGAPLALSEAAAAKIGLTLLAVFAVPINMALL